MKTMFLIIFFYTTPWFAQTFLHPGQMSAGYHFTHSMPENYNLNIHTVYFSSGKFDLYCSLAETELNTKSLQAFMIGAAIVILKEDRKFMPAINFGLGGASGNSSFNLAGIGPSAGWLLELTRNFIVVPDISASITFMDVAKLEGIGKANLSLGATMHFGFVTEGIFIFTLSPGYSVTEAASFYNFSAGLSIFLGKD